MQHRIEVDKRDTDIDIVLPGGQVVQLQFRVMSPSIDVCLPEECSVTNWEGDDMKPASPVGGKAHVLLAKQLAINLNPTWVKTPQPVAASHHV